MKTINYAAALAVGAGLLAASSGVASADTLVCDYDRYSGYEIHLYNDGPLGCGDAVSSMDQFLTMVETTSQKYGTVAGYNCAIHGATVSDEQDGRIVLCDGSRGVLMLEPIGKPLMDLV